MFRVTWTIFLYELQPTILVLEKPFGFVVIDKPAGLTSHDCVNRLRRVYEMRRIGHGGTLDPAVSGVLPIAIGKATRLLQFLPSSKKYKGTIQFGIKTNTNDLQGEVISRMSVPKLQKIDLSNSIKEFEGQIKQYPPKFSSIHISGERAYAKARRGEKFELAPREITIHKLEIISWDQANGRLKIQVHCSSGTYIRALARDIGDKIGCGAALASLQRTEALGFTIKEAIPLPSIEGTKSIIKPNLINPLNAIDHLPKIILTSEENDSWRKGRAIIIQQNRLHYISNNFKLNKQVDFILVLNEEEVFVGVAYLDKQSFEIKPKIVFNADG